MANNNDFLFEIGTEELPPKELPKLAAALASGITQGLTAAGLSFQASKHFAAPRRLAVKITGLAALQPTRVIEKKGPALTAAFDAQGNPSQACAGFARSCGVTVDQLVTSETAQGAWLVYRSEELGKSLAELIPDIIEKALHELPVAKTMRWGERSQKFIRPIHWMVLLHGETVITTEILAVKTGNVTYGHRFHHPQPIVIQHPREYEQVLADAKVIVDFEQRSLQIQEQIEHIAKTNKAEAVIEKALLDEVTAIVEWPVALLAGFEARFLKVPKEALISAMQNHQKCFPLIDTTGNLLAHFIFISNIQSKAPAEVIAGNERVMRARLADAEFFFQQDLKQPLGDRLAGLQHVLFQAKLGSLADKSQRIARLAEFIAQQIDAAQFEHARRAGELCKTDLLTTMVGEFPELQGIMGYYYALHDNESPEVAMAIREHYLPRSAHDELPTSLLGSVVALADRFDTLVGLFGIQQPPTGNKDPFGLRRAALAIIKLIMHQGLSLNIGQLLTAAAQGYTQPLENPQLIKQTHEFILERLPGMFLEHDNSSNLIAAVLAVQSDDMLDVSYRIDAVQKFMLLPEATALAAANKRVSNILSKLDYTPTPIDENLFEHAAESELYQIILAKQSQQDKANRSAEFYTQQLQSLAALQKPIDAFFEQVMVMTDNQAIQHNRLALLTDMRNLFLQVADISLLQL